MTPVILSGGSGTRLWPVSRASYPKQFCDFYDRSFLYGSLERVKTLGSPMVVTVQSMKELTLRTLTSMGFGPEQVIFEPLGKNTAPAIALTCHILAQRGQSSEIVGFFPADHLILDTKTFLRAVELAVGCAEQGKIVTLGIQPTHPSTGYGYIELSQKTFSEEGSLKAFETVAFHEKPSKEKAEEFLNAGQFFWNAGMFVFKVSKMIESFEKHLPEVWRRIAQINPDFSNAKIQYANCENISIDYGVMEKLNELVCIPCDMGWSDVGSWDELARLGEEVPELRSATRANVFSEGSQGNFVYTVRPKVVGLVGVNDLIVVDTPDALLVSRKGESQKVKNVLDEIRHAGLPEATEHPFEYRPWGGFEILADRAGFKVKRITVEPGQQLSYQSHENRTENWTVVQGQGQVILDDKSQMLSPGDSVKIPPQCKHRIRNPGRESLVFVEVQTGSYFGEDDITRYADDYNRA